MRKRQKPAKKQRQEVNIVNQAATSMRGLVEAARAPLARRLITPAKAMAQINELAKRTQHELNQVHHRERQSLQTVNSQVPRRQQTDKRNMPRQVLSAQVRQFRNDARRALVCQSRANRREVLFALQRTGRNGNGNRKAVWSALSYVSCKKRG